MSRDPEEQVVGDTLVIVKHEFAGLDIDPVDGALGVQADTPLPEHPRQRVAEHRARGRHGKWLGRIDVNGRLVAPATPPQQRLGQERRFVRRGWALVRHPRHHHHDATTDALAQRSAGRDRSLERVKVVCGLAEPGNDLRSEFGTQRDNELIEPQRRLGSLHEPTRGIDFEHIGAQHLDALATLAVEGPTHLFGPPGATHHPQERRSEPQHRTSFHKHDPVIRPETPAQTAGNNNATGPTAQDHYRPRAHVRPLSAAASPPSHSIPSLRAG